MLQHHPPSDLIFLMASSFAGRSLASACNSTKRCSTVGIDAQHWKTFCQDAEAGVTRMTGRHWNDWAIRTKPSVTRGRACSAECEAVIFGQRRPIAEHLDVVRGRPRHGRRRRLAVAGHLGPRPRETSSPALDGGDAVHN